MLPSKQAGQQTPGSAKKKNKKKNKERGSDEGDSTNIPNLDWPALADKIGIQLLKETTPVVLCQGVFRKCVMLIGVISTCQVCCCVCHTRLWKI